MLFSYRRADFVWSMFSVQLRASFIKNTELVMCVNEKEITIKTEPFTECTHGVCLTLCLGFAMFSLTFARKLEKNANKQTNNFCICVMKKCGVLFYSPLN